MASPACPSLVLGCLLALTTLPRGVEGAALKDIHPERELMITAPAVVDSQQAQYPGVWSFGGLLERLVGKDAVAATLRDWLQTWVAPQKVGSQDVLPRPGIVDKVILPWQKRDGYVPDPEKSWQPNPRNAPFRLLAVVNRIDLCAPAVAGSMKEVQDSWKKHGREQEFTKLLLQMVGSFGGATTVGGGGGGGYGFTGGPSLGQSLGNFREGNKIHIFEATSAGEGRFVFGAVDENGAPLEGGWTVILEFPLAASSVNDVREWAQRWHDLSGLDVNDPKYLAALEAVTRAFTHAKDARLGQLRTSEAVFGPGREFRQFTMPSASLTLSELSQTPSPVFGLKASPQQRALAAFLHEVDPLVRSGIHLLPAEVPAPRGTFSLAAGTAFIPAGEQNFYWDPGQQVSREARRTFSLNTCNGCHGGETACAEGLHIRPRTAGQEAALSSFLNREGQPLRINDPDIKGSKVQFEEMSDRARILAALLESHDRGAATALQPVLRARLARTH